MALRYALQLALVLAAAAVAGAATTSPFSNAPLLYRQAGAPIAARVDDLVSRMTLLEKTASLTHLYAYPSIDIKAVFGATGLAQVSEQTSIVQATPLATVRARNELQSFFINSSRLGIPLSFAHEGLHGGGLFGTIFPMPAATVCSWNESLFQQIGAAQADEARAHGVDDTFSPVVNLWGEDARFGRYQEGPGPDPTVASHFGTALVLGLQGGQGDQQDYLPDFNKTVVSTGKHFLGYGAALGGLNGGENTHSNRTVFEVFLRPWRAMVAAGLRSAMPSHNTVDLVPMHANRYFIDTVLRGEFGFGNGSTVSDCSDVDGLVSYGVAENISVAAALGTLAGVDLDLACGKIAYFGVLNVSLAEGLVTEQDIDINVAHVLTQKFAAGLFDSPYTPESWVDTRINPPAHVQLALEAAQQSAVLLTNPTGVLPLKVPGGGGAGYKVAMIGPLIACDDKNESSAGWFSQYGTSYGPLAPDTKAYATCYGRINTLGSYILDEGWVDVPLVPDAWKATFPSSSISVSLGAKITSSEPRPDLIAQAVAAAAAADVAIVVAGDDMSTCGEWVDRDDLDLPGSQIALLQALVNQTTTPIVLVLLNGRAMSFGPGNALLSQLAAVVEMWRPGQGGSQAVVDVLTGRVNPSGKLTNSWSQGVGSIGSGASPWLSRIQGKWVANNRSSPDPTDNRVYDPYVSSQYGAASGLPLFRFGHGLSYTTFNVTAISVTVVPGSHPRDLPHGGRFSGRGKAGYRAALSTNILQAAVTVCNTGSVDGTEVVQVYSQDARGIDVSPMGIAPFWKRLVGFGRVFVPAGGPCQVITLPVTADDLAMYDDDMVLRVIPGSYTISAGGRSDQDFAQQKVVLEGPAAGSEHGREGESPRDRLVRAMSRRK